MRVDCIARNVIDQIGFDDYRLVSDIKREEAEARGEDLFKLMGVLLSIEDRDSRSLQSLRHSKWSSISRPPRISQPVSAFPAPSSAPPPIVDASRIVMRSPGAYARKVPILFPILPIYSLRNLKVFLG